MKKDLFYKIIAELHLGEFITEPKRVTGGFIHKMYKFETTTGVYAVKLLNPAIMKRPDALANFQRAESLEKKLEMNKLPIVPAVEMAGKKMQCIEGQYFYVFEWVNGCKLKWKDINDEHCKVIGKLLAKIHKIEQVSGSFVETVNIDWDDYIEQAKASCPEIVDLLLENRDLLYEAQDSYNQAMKSLPDISCITDGDLDCKNVLWTDRKPMIIDLESLDYGNSQLDMFRLALDWSGGVDCKINYALLKEFIDSYINEYGTLDADWNKLYGIGFSWIEWLDFNVKRALMIECENEEERRLGIEQIRGTIPRIVYYASIKDELLNQLTGI